MLIKHVLVAHRGGARLFSYLPESHSLVIQERFEFPFGKLRDKDLDADRPGRTVTSFRFGKSPLSDERDSVDHEETLSAELLVKRLRKDHDRYAKTGIVIAAGPHFMGKIRSLVAGHLGDAAVYLTKDLAKVPDHKVFRHVERSLNRPGF